MTDDERACNAAKNSNAKSMHEEDKLHRTLALDIEKSFIVQAPAGSGKTELLIQRFLTLLATVSRPEEILAITFTKKAANEMRLRVMKALKQAAYESESESHHQQKTWKLAKNVLLRDKILQWNILNNPNQLRIQTIDSLCSYLTKQLPLLSHFGSQPDITNNPKSLYQEAVQEVLMHLEKNYEWSDAIMQLLLHLDNDLNKLNELLVNLLSKRDQWLPYIQFNSTDIEIRKYLENQLQLTISETLIKVKNIFPEKQLSELISIAQFASIHPDIEPEIFACRDMTSQLSATAADKIIWLGLTKLLLTKNFTWRKKVSAEIGFPSLKQIKNAQELALHKAYRDRFSLLIETLNENETLRSALEEIFYLPNTHYSDDQWKILQSLLYVLKMVAAQLRLTFQQYGQIDFIENTQAALTALGDDDHPADLALALDYQIKHILIDEFQDTSYTQYQLLKKLTQAWQPNDGRSLFIVGDPMQSIYRFREAEVGLFIRMFHHGLPNIKLIPLSLTVNFRSTSNIVEWNNIHFQNIFPKLDDIKTGSVSYHCSMAHQTEMHAKNQINVNGFVETTYINETNHIVQFIQDRLTEAPDETIAILVRSRSHLIDIIPALNKAKLAYRAIDIDPLSSKQIIQDLFSLTRALINPLDRIAWLSLLRAPWCGLTLSDLLIIAGNDKQTPILSQLNNQVCNTVKNSSTKSISSDGKQRINKILSILNTKIAMREREDLRTWIESTWFLLGGPAALTHYDEIKDAQAYFELLQKLNHSQSLFNIEILKEKINHLYASTQHDHAMLNIMTIHSAKGLEFDTVILPQLHKKNPTDDKALLSWMEHPIENNQAALLLAPIHATGNEKDKTYEYISRQQKIKSNYETDRLFYVATTRAKKRLYLTFNASLNQDQKLTTSPGSFLEKIWPVLKNHHQYHLNDHQVAQTEAKVLPRYIQRHDSDWINPIQTMSNTNVAFHQKSKGFFLSDSIMQTIGTVIHLLLQQLSIQGLNWWESQSDTQKDHYLQFQFLKNALTRSQFAYAKQAVMQSIENTLLDEKGKWILTAHKNAKSEYAITAMINHKAVSMIIDKTFEDEDGTIWIIDYKTTSPHLENINQFISKEINKYTEQIRQYQFALQAIHPAKIIRAGLYFTAIPAWQEFNPQIYLKSLG